VEKKEVQGVFGQTAISFLPLDLEQRGGGGSGAAGRRRLPASRATTAVGMQGKMKRATRGIDSPTHLGL
jgi:hypothetical protein